MDVDPLERDEKLAVIRKVYETAEFSMVSYFISD
jgi:hypothetical protein